METDLPEAQLSRSLLDWYDQHHRKLPWRNHPKLYPTVVSEFMLQQTQIKTALPYYERWLQIFPDFETLAQASEEAVLRQWEGLGYYRRARNLHKLAKEWIAADPKPESYETWLAFTGVGPYMAAAITSIIFDEPRVVVDGNVVRVICRLEAIDTTFKDSSQAVRAVRPIAQDLMEAERPGDFNQAIMELGALVCRPRNPICGECPWRESCVALKKDLVLSLPDICKASSVKITRKRLLVIHSGKKQVLLVRGGMQGRLEGMYELPLIDSEDIADLQHVSTIKRGISNELISEPVYRAQVRGYRRYVHKKTEPVWIPFESLNEIAVSGPHRKWLSDFLASGEGSC